MRAIEQPRVRSNPVDGIGPLRRRSADDDWQVRRTAVRRSLAAAIAALVDALVSALRDGHRDFSVLSSALQLLTDDRRRLTAALVDLLRHPDADLRIQAALALGTQAGPEAAAALLAALDDPDANVRFHAIEALGQARARRGRGAAGGDRRVARLLPGLSARSTRWRGSTIPRSRRASCRCCADDAGRRSRGRGAGTDRRRRRRRPLRGGARSPGASASSIVDALAAIHRRYGEMLRRRRADRGSRPRSASRPPARNALIDAAGAAPRARRCGNSWSCSAGCAAPAVERALTRMLGTPGGAPRADRGDRPLRRADGRSCLIEQLGPATTLETRRAAVAALGRIGDARAVPALIALLDEDDRELLVPVAGALARLGDGRAFEPPAASARRRQVAVRHGGDRRAQLRSAIPDMAARMQTLHRRSPIRSCASRRSRSPATSATRAAPTALPRTVPRRRRRRCAPLRLEHVAFLDDDRVLPVLVDGARATIRPRVERRRRRRSAHVDAPDAIAALRRAVQRSGSWVRYFSASSLGRQADASALPLLETLRANDELEHVRIAAVDAIGGARRRARGRRAACRCRGVGGPMWRTRAVHGPLGAVSAASALEPLRRALSGDLTPRAAPSRPRRWRAGAGEPAVALPAVDGGGGQRSRRGARGAIAGLRRIGSLRDARRRPRRSPRSPAVAGDPARRADAIAALSRRDRRRDPCGRRVSVRRRSACAPRRRRGAGPAVASDGLRVRQERASTTATPRCGRPRSTVRRRPRHCEAWRGRLRDLAATDPSRPPCARAAEALRRAGEAGQAAATTRHDVFSPRALWAFQPTGLPRAARAHSRADRAVLRRTVAAISWRSGWRRSSWSAGSDRSWICYYLLQYDDAGRGRVAAGARRAVGAGNLLLARDRSDSRDRLPRRAGAGARGRAAPIRIWSAPCATRRGAADDRDGAERGGLVRSRRRSRSTPATAARRRSPRRGPGATGSARCAALPAGAAGEVLRRRRRHVHARAELAQRITSWSVVNLMRPTDGRPVRAQPDRASAGTRSSISRRRRSSRSSAQLRAR